jgi:hypothetical protein
VHVALGIYDRTSQIIFQPLMFLFQFAFLNQFVFQERYPLDCFPVLAFNVL